MLHIQTVLEYILEHVVSCSTCNIEKGKHCSVMEQARKEILERFTHYDTFFKVIKSLEEMISWVGVVKE